MALPDFHLPPPSHAVYPIKGRSLTKEDVGMRVVRIAPVTTKFGAEDFSYMTIHHKAIDVFDYACKVIDFKYGCVTVKRGSCTMELKPVFLDSNWLNVYEYLNRIQGKVPEIFDADTFDEFEFHI